MAHISPFAAIRYVPEKRFDLSNVIAPPYDVLDEAQKSALQAKDPHNIVTIDLPFMPPKTVGPDAVYEKANITLQAWMSAGILHQDRKRAIYPYTQSYEHNGKMYHRRGMIALVKLSPFGQGQVIPHEKTHKGPIEDRIKLMRATGVQLSPIFGLFSDTHGEVNKILYENAGRPILDGTYAGVRNQMWSVTDNSVENKVIDFMGTRPVYIADGHHRYTTALQYQVEQVEANGGKALPDNHAANWCMFVLVPMQDDGLVILPTHRLIGGVDSFDIKVFKDAVNGNFDVEETALKPDQVAEFADTVLPLQPAHTFGLFDARTKKLYKLICKNQDVLEKLEPDQSEPWRRLDVAILQRYLLDEIIQRTFAGGKELVKNYTAYGSEIVPSIEKNKSQIALILKSTPIGALEQLGRHGEVMPQKSTFFYPKLATGMAINSLR